MGDILISGGNPFSVVALDQPFIGPALDHQRQFPGEVFGILDAGIRAARSEG